jgi:hypothetical protein
MQYAMGATQKTPLLWFNFPRSFPCSLQNSFVAYQSNFPLRYKSPKGLIIFILWSFLHTATSQVAMIEWFQNDWFHFKNVMF